MPLSVQVTKKNDIIAQQVLCEPFESFDNNVGSPIWCPEKDFLK